MNSYYNLKDIRWTNIKLRMIVVFVLLKFLNTG